MIYHKHPKIINLIDNNNSHLNRSLVLFKAPSKSSLNYPSINLIDDCLH